MYFCNSIYLKEYLGLANKMGFQKRMTHLYALDHESALQLGEHLAGLGVANPKRI